MKSLTAELRTNSKQIAFKSLQVARKNNMQVSCISFVYICFLLSIVSIYVSFPRPWICMWMQACTRLYGRPTVFIVRGSISQSFKAMHLDAGLHKILWKANSFLKQQLFYHYTLPTLVQALGFQLDNVIAGIARTMSDYIRDSSI